IPLPQAGEGVRSGVPSPLRRFMLLLVVDFLEIGVDHLVVARPVTAGALAAARSVIRGAAVAGPGSGPARSGRLGLAGLVHRLAELHREGAERLGLGLD